MVRLRGILTRGTGRRDGRGHAVRRRTDRASDDRELGVVHLRMASTAPQGYARGSDGGGSGSEGVGFHLGRIERGSGGLVPVCRDPNLNETTPGIASKPLSLPRPSHFHRLPEFRPLKPIGEKPGKAECSVTAATMQLSQAYRSQPPSRPVLTGFHGLY